MFEAAWVAIVTIIAGIAFGVERSRRVEGPSAYWVAAVGAIFAAGLCNLLIVQPGGSRFLLLPQYALSMTFPAILLAGALHISGLRVPGWMVPGAAGLGLVRGLLALGGQAALASGIAAVLAPAAAAAAAVLVYRTSRTGASLSERLLAPTLLGVALLLLATEFTVQSGEAMPWVLLGPWMASIPLIMASGYAAESDRAAEVLRRAREDLEHRVEERTRELRESEERYRTVSELCSDFAFAIWIRADRTVQFDWVTAAVSRITGYEAQEIESGGWASIVHPEDRASVMEAIDRILLGEPSSLEFRILTKTGELRWMFLVAGARRREPDGSVLVVGSARNITESKKTEQDRRQLDQHLQEVQRLESLGVLAGGIAHDFNNILTVIRGNSRLAMDDLGNDSPQHERLSRIQAAAEYAQGLTRQMLTYSGDASLSLHPMDLSQLVLEMLDLLRASVAKKGQLDVDLAEALPAIEADETQIRQVLLNLVTNAAEALADTGGCITVRTRVCHVGREELAGAFGTPDPEPGEYVALEVSDTGQGIEESRIARVFEPFFTSRTSGRGLGLAVVLGIARAHRGVIQLESKLGEGTTFRVLVPSSQRAISEPRLAPVPDEPSRGSGTVLVVDDQEAVIEVAEEFLQRAGFEVLTASGGRAAVEALRMHGDEIDVVVLDLVMPEMGGEETFDALRRLRPELPILVVSGYDKEMARERFFGRGIAGFLYKPYEPEELIERVRSAIEG